MKVVVFPIEAPNNPVIKILNSALRERGVEISDFNWITSGIERTDLFHVHWPDAVVMGKSRLRAAIKVALFLKSVLLFRLRGVPILWTVHNTTSNNRYHPALEASLWRWFLPRVSAFHHLARWSTAIVSSQGRPSRIIPHPDYRNVLSTRLARSEARRELNIPGAATVVLTFGQIAPYKGLDRLVGIFKNIQDKNIFLVICGQAKDKTYYEALCLQAESDPRIRIREGYLEDIDLQRYNEAADLVLLPYAKVNNSGAAIFALSVGRCILAPSSGSIVDLVEEVGDDWVFTFGQTLSEDDLRDGVAKAKSKSDRSLPPMLALAPETVGQQMFEYYSEITGLGARRSGAAVLPASSPP